MANRWQEFQIETKLSHELFISNQTLNAPAMPNVRTGVKKYIMLGMLSLCLVVSGLAGAAQKSGRWELLGRRDVDFRYDHDQIDVGKDEGRFKQLQFRVKDAPIELSRMVVTFANNETFSPVIGHRFAEGSGTHVIDLPGNRRIIKRIDFDYKSISRREGKGTVEVLAR